MKIKQFIERKKAISSNIMQILGWIIFFAIILFSVYLLLKNLLI